MKKKQYKKKYQTQGITGDQASNTLAGAGQVASLAMSGNDNVGAGILSGGMSGGMAGASFGPLGAGIGFAGGALIGGISAGINKKKNRLASEAEAERQKMEDEWNRTATAMYDPNVYSNPYAMAMGGVVPQQDVEIEGGETLYKPEDAGAVYGQEQGLSSKGSKVTGNSHGEGGIDATLPEGTFVFSKRFKMQGKSLAKHSEGVMKSIGKAERTLTSPKSSDLAKTTAERNMRNGEMRLQNLMKLQKQMTEAEKAKGNVTKDGLLKEQPQQYMYGGPVRKKYAIDGEVDMFNPNGTYNWTGNIVNPAMVAQADAMQPSNIKTSNYSPLQWAPLNPNSGTMKSTPPPPNNFTPPGFSENYGKYASSIYNIAKSFDKPQKLNAQDYTVPYVNPQQVSYKSMINDAKSQGAAMLKASKSGNLGSQGVINRMRAASSSVNREIGKIREAEETTNAQLRGEAARMNADIAAKNAQLKFGVDDWNAKSLAAKDSYMGEGMKDLQNISYYSQRDRNQFNLDGYYKNFVGSNYYMLDENGLPIYRTGSAGTAPLSSKKATKTNKYKTNK